MMIFLFVTGFAGKNRQGRKEELLSRALDLVKLRSVPLQAKIREIYKASQEAQQQVWSLLKHNLDADQFYQFRFCQEKLN